MSCKHESPPMPPELAEMLGKFVSPPYEPISRARFFATEPGLLAALQMLLRASQPQDSMKPGYVHLGEAQEAAQLAITAHLVNQGGDK